MSIKLTVNGRSQTVDVAGDTPLLWVLRDVLNMKGTKYGCGVAYCGACTVHLNGKAVRSCQTAASAAANQQITTVEGLSADGTHPVQQAWIEIDVPQCGYCQAGQMMSRHGPAGQELQKTIRRRHRCRNVNGNACRCGTYLRIRQWLYDKAAAIAANKTPTNSASVKDGTVAAR